MSADVFDADQLRAATFVRHVEVHDTLSSTNVRATELARLPDIELPALVVARQQTAGKGRGQNAWWSADGALTFSLLLEPAALGIATSSWPQLSLATAVALCDALEMVISSQRAGASPPPSLSIKWPNDVLLNNRKVSGILLESPAGSAPAKNRLIVGIGINVNNSLNGAPPDVAQAAIALCDVASTQHDLQNVLASVMESIERRYQQLADADSQLPQSWARLSSLTNQPVTIIGSDGRSLHGTCLGIADDGALLLNVGDRTERVYSGSVAR